MLKLRSFNRSDDIAQKYSFHFETAHCKTGNHDFMFSELVRFRDYISWGIVVRLSVNAQLDLLTTATRLRDIEQIDLVTLEN